MFRLIWTFGGDSEVFCLGFGELRENDANFFQMQAGHFFVELFRQPINRVFVFVLVLPEVDLSEGLVSEGIGHHEAGMTGGATEIH